MPASRSRRSLESISCAILTPISTLVSGAMVVSSMATLTIATLTMEISSLVKGEGLGLGLGFDLDADLHLVLCGHAILLRHHVRC